MDEWLFTETDLMNTPSIKMGCTLEQESKWRIEGVQLIVRVAGALNLKVRRTIFTAAVFYHRFYMFNSFQEYKLEFVALCSIFLAGKVEDTPKKIGTIVSEACKFENFQHFTNSYIHDQMLALEKVLLQTLRFDLIIENPYKYINDYIKALDSSLETKSLTQTAYTFVNDSIYTTLCLEWEPQILAIVMIHLSCIFYEKKPDNPAWYEEYVMCLSLETLDNICHKVIDFYSEQKKI